MLAEVVKDNPKLEAIRRIIKQEQSVEAEAWMRIVKREGCDMDQAFMVSKEDYDREVEEVRKERARVVES